jgi:hypothetical protein
VQTLWQCSQWMMLRLATTGQDGINIGIGISKVTIDQLAIHDNDGFDKYKNGGQQLFQEIRYS